MCEDSLKLLSYIVSYTGVSKLIPHPFCPCHVPNPHMPLGDFRAEKTFIHDTWGLMREGEAGGFCTGRGRLCSAVAQLLAQRYTAESWGSVG